MTELSFSKAKKRIKLKCRVHTWVGINEARINYNSYEASKAFCGPYAGCMDVLGVQSRKITLKTSGMNLKLKIKKKFNFHIFF